MIRPSSCQMTPVPPPLPSVRTCTMAGCACSKMAVRASEKTSGNADEVENVVDCVICLLPLLSLPDRHLQGMKRIATNHLDRHRFAYALSCQQHLQILGIAYGMPIKRNQDIAKQNTCLLRRAVLIDIQDEQSVFLGLSTPLRLGNLHQLAADTQVATRNMSLLSQGVSGACRDIERNCQRQAVHQPRR